MNTNPTKKSPAPVASDPQGREIQIRRCAYELYEERGLDDWLRAEEAITGTKVKAAAA